MEVSLLSLLLLNITSGEPLLQYFLSRKGFKQEPLITGSEDDFFFGRLLLANDFETFLVVNRPSNSVSCPGQVCNVICERPVGVSVDLPASS